jgi:CRP-like cAMP-binding protein
VTGYTLPLAQPSALTDSRPAGKVATSREAFRGQQESGKRETDQARIADYITRRGTYGATSHEIKHDLGLEQATISARCNDLLRSGYLTRAGDTRSVERRDGRRAPAFVWRWVGAL